MKLIFFFFGVVEKTWQNVFGLLLQLLFLDVLIAF